MGQAPVAGTRGVRERRRLVVGVVGLVINGVVATALDRRIVAIDGIGIGGRVDLAGVVDRRRIEVLSDLEDIRPISNLKRVNGFQNVM